MTIYIFSWIHFTYQQYILEKVGMDEVRPRIASTLYLPNVLSWQRYQGSVRLEYTELYHVCVTYTSNVVYLVFHSRADREGGGTIDTCTNPCDVYQWKMIWVGDVRIYQWFWFRQISETANMLGPYSMRIISYNIYIYQRVGQKAIDITNTE